MFWADIVADKALHELEKRGVLGKKIVIRDEKTISGQVHIGSMRGAAIHGLISEILTERGIDNEYLYELNDFDVFDSVPGYLDEATYAPHLGKLLRDVPSPDPSAANFAEYYGAEFAHVIEHAAFRPTYYRSSEKYAEGLFDESIKIALNRASEIREIYQRVSGSQKGPDWYPLSVVCEHCGKIATTVVESWDGEKVSYLCKKDNVAYTEGCGHRSTVSPYGGAAKLPWKVEWAAKFKIFNVEIEGAGKDHSTKGGSRDVANNIARDVFGYQPPFDIPYEFFLVGGAKMSSSKGRGSAAKDVAELLPPRIFRLALLGKDIKQQINFDPQGDTVPLLFDQFDKIAKKEWSGLADDETRLFALIHPPGERANIPEHFLPRFRELAFIVQMTHLDYEKELERIKGAPLTPEDIAEGKVRADVAKYWLASYAPEQFRFDPQMHDVPDAARFFTPKQKSALRDVIKYVEAHDPLDGQELHTALHDIRKESGLDAAVFFNSIYFSFLGKPMGPKAGWFLSVLDRDFLLKRLKEVSE